MTFPSRLLIALLPLVLGCASSSRGTHTLPPSTGLVSVCMTSTGTQDWVEIDVKIVSVTLTPQGGGAPVALLAPQTGPLPVNLALLGRATQLIGSLAAPVGTYTGATVTLASASGDVVLNVSSTPSPQFPQAAQTAVPQLWISGANGAKTLALAVPFAAPLVVTTDRNVVLDLEWDTARPGFLTGAAVPRLASVYWTVNFENSLRQRVVADPAGLDLLPLRGSVYKVDASRKSFQMSPTFRAGVFNAGFLPQLVGVTVDAAGGAYFFDVDDGTRKVIKDLSAVGDALPGRPVSVRGTLQQDGTLLATRIWAGTGTFLGTQIQGRVVRVDPGRALAAFDGDALNGWTAGSGGVVTEETLFMAPAPEAGPGFLSAGNLALGFTAIPVFRFPLHGAVTLLSVDIVSPDFKGTVTAVDGNQVTLSCPTGTDAAALVPVLPFAGPAGGSGGAGTIQQGFSWWEAGAPDRIQAGAASFAGAAAAVVDFGGTVGAMRALATVHAVWGNAANPAGWSAQWAVLETLPLPAGTVAEAYASSGFGLMLPGGANTVTVDMDASTVCYRADLPATDWYGGNPYPVLTEVSPATALLKGAAVKVFGIPAADGHLKARAVFQCVYHSF
ncbi:DUF5666 domain-containing protein [Geothrix sp. 21YS21S-2]|uniref:DUF5666 domain-containing protein n=1 Tax=Geothrix sp. 21YS21S-2 TaxID=3068893 RepID=UPI0027B9E211|nr:DUF5666 domain-containing protein [Geothrix sp. 21YS21S-2]